MIMADFGSEKNITAKQTKLINSLIESKTITDACHQDGIAQRTAFRWLNDRVFTRALRLAEDQIQDAVTRRLINRTMRNIEILESIADNADANDNARIRAVEAMTDCMFKIYDMRNTQTRLTDLEEEVYFHVNIRQ